MKPPLKLSAIEQEHLQELYNAAGIARDELPYTPAYETLWQGFQDRTFKNAARDQVFGAILKYTRSSTNAASSSVPASVLNEDQKKQLKSLLARHAGGGKVLPYSEEFEAALKEFNKAANTTLAEGDFWRAILSSQGAKRRPPARKAAAKVAAESSEDDEE